MINYHRTLFTMALMGFAALLLALPATANADRGDRREHAKEVRDEGRQRHEAHRHDEGRRRGEARAEEHRDRHERHARQRHHGHGKKSHFAQRSSHRRHARSHDARRHHARQVTQQRQAARYYCERCCHRFTSRDRFRNHLRHRHHVPAWRLSRVIVPHILGWVFYG